MQSILLVLLGACSYGALSTLVKLAYGRGFGTGQVVGSQMLLGAALCWLLALAKGRSRASPRQALALMAAGAPVGLTGCLYYASLRYQGAALAVVLLFQFTWMGVLVEAVQARRWPGKEKLASLGVLALGTLFASGVAEGGAGSLSLIGLGLGLLSAVSYTAVILASGKVALAIDPFVRSAWMVTGGLVVALAVFPPAFLVDGSLTHGLWPWGLALGFLGMVVPTVCFARGMPHVGPGLGAILGAAELPTATLMATAVLGEQMTALRWVGVVLVLAGVALPELRVRRAAVQA
ncbi:EamA family transporter [Aggregicoccus sp. 17bor-14]|uniref:EamA family transporter n=1 Tax=Myxococcaceae TaxID=31 RepID=UPI00129CDE4F|nr:MULTISPECIES: EamA family transporter [Myxococcaceae]MBF5042172.1 EamA family transporter [Simulacricoccus sp. 17bor-14]MRI87949.1 EamA family transporter [Aggregicoccus sp. 17bor-14]